MEHKNMTVEEAAKRLHDQLQDAPWLTAVGVGQSGGEKCIFVYGKSLEAAKKDFASNPWHGFLVEMRKMSTTRLVIGEGEKKNGGCLRGGVWGGWGGWYAGRQRGWQIEKRGARAARSKAARKKSQLGSPPGVRGRVVGRTHPSRNRVNPRSVR